MSQTSVYKETPMKEINIISLYERLNQARINNYLDELPIPSLVETAITASSINNLLNDIFATKTASAFLSELELPFSVSIHQDDRARAISSIAQLEKNLSKLEAACIDNAVNRSAYISGVDNPQTCTGNKSSNFASDYDSDYGVNHSKNGTVSSNSSNFSSDHGHSPACSSNNGGNFSPYTPGCSPDNKSNFSPYTTGCSTDRSGFVFQHNFQVFHSSNASCTGRCATQHGSNKKANFTCQSDTGTKTCVGDHGNAASINCSGNNSSNAPSCSDNSSNCSGRNSSNFTSVNSSVFSTVKSSDCAKKTSNKAPNFTADYTTNCSADDSSNYTANCGGDYTINYVAYTIEGIDF